jgi:hypothetical protein
MIDGLAAKKHLYRYLAELRLLPPPRGLQAAWSICRAIQLSASSALSFRPDRPPSCEAEQPETVLSRYL